MGDKFYIILQGSVNVLIPSPEVKEAKKKIEESQYDIDKKKLELKVITN